MISHRGLRHLALRVNDVARAVEFYTRVFGMRLVWQPESSAGALDHLGFVVATVADLEAGWRWAEAARLEIVHPLRQHRDGSVSFYIRDPDGNVIQLLFEPNISPLEVGTPKV
jgi:catechol 2,3-dioxygenase-like lactoylglutathione lyase family enzyme